MGKFIYWWSMILSWNILHQEVLKEDQLNTFDYPVRRMSCRFFIAHVMYFVVVRYITICLILVE